MSPANQLRALIAAQLLGVALMGVAARAERWGPLPPEAYWLGAACVAGFYPAFFGFPILAFRAAIRANLPGWELWMIAGVETALTYALFVALWPAFQ